MLAVAGTRISSTFADFEPGRQSLSTKERAQGLPMRLKVKETKG